MGASGILVRDTSIACSGSINGMLPMPVARNGVFMIIEVIFHGLKQIEAALFGAT